MVFDDHRIRGARDGGHRTSQDASKSGIPNFELHTAAPILQIHRWPTDGPAHFRVIYAGASNANCTKHHLFGHSKRPATLFREGAKCFISGARMQGRVAFFPPAFTRAHSSANFQQGQTWRTIVASVIPPNTFAVAPIIAHTKEALHIHLSLKEKFFRLSGWGTLSRRVLGRVECPSQALKPWKTRLRPQNAWPDASGGDKMVEMEQRSRLTTCKQPWSTIEARQMPISRFRAPQRRHRRPGIPAHQNGSCTP